MDSRNTDLPAVTQNLRIAVRNIDKTHKLPTFNLFDPAQKKTTWTQRKKVGASGQTNGQYAGYSKSIDIKQGLKGSNQRLTAYHEFGHFIDDNFLGVISQGFSKNNIYGSQIGSRAVSAKRLDAASALGSQGQTKLKKLMDFIKGTDSYFTLINPASVKKYSAGYVNYVSSDVELFARAYAQYVAEKSNDEPLQAFLRTLRNGNEGYMPTSQWSAAEMKDMVPLFDDMFEELVKANNFNTVLTPYKIIWYDRTRPVH